MGTVVVLPQDCLTASHRRHEKNHFRNMIYLQEAPQRAKRNYSHASSRKLNSQNRHFENSSSHVSHSTPKKSGDAKLSKTRKLADENSRGSTGFPVVTILQRPQDKETRELIFTQFIMDLKSSSTKVTKGEVEDTSIKSSRNIPDSDKTKNIKIPQNIKSKSETAKYVKPHRDQKTVGGKSGMTRVPSGNKPLNIMEKKSDKVNTAKASRTEYKKAIIKKDDNLASKKDDNLASKIAEDNDAQKTDILIRRASTDPQAVVQLANQYRLNLAAEESTQKLQNFNKTISTAENWAGSAYSFSPAPSALPLPKFSLNLKTSSLHQLPMSKPEEPRHVYTQPTVVISSPTEEKVAANYDVVLATKSLRKILNLDP